MDIKSEYHPSPKQILAHDSPTVWTMFGGAEYGGKTRWGCEEILRMMLDYPGLEALICRFYYADVVEPTQARDLFFKILPKGMIKGEPYMSPPSWVRIHNGSRVTFSGLKDYKPSSEYGAMFIDQAEEVPEETLRLLFGRLRQDVLTDEQRRLLLSCNPHPNMEWYLKE